MADVDHPKTHVEDQVEKGDVTLPRKQPLSPQHEGIDPLTESDTMYPAENTKADSTKLSKKLANTPYEAPASDPANQPVNADDSDTPASDTQESVTDQSNDTHQAADSADRKATEEAGDNDSGKLPRDAQVANRVSSDKQNTSASNKPATQDKPAGTTDSKTTDK